MVTPAGRPPGSSQFSEDVLPHERPGGETPRGSAFDDFVQLAQAHLHQSEFGGDEKAVERHKKGDPENLAAD